MYPKMVTILSQVSRFWVRFCFILCVIVSEMPSCSRTGLHQLRQCWLPAPPSPAAPGPQVTRTVPDILSQEGPSRAQRPGPSLSPGSALHGSAALQPALSLCAGLRSR